LSRFRSYLGAWIQIGVVVVAALVLIVAVVAALGDVVPVYSAQQRLSELNRIRVELPRARRLWETHGTANYNVDVAMLIHPSCLIMESVTIEVRDGEVVAPEEAVRASEDPSNCYYYVNRLLPSQAFDAVEQAVESLSEDNYLSVSFDPSYGFVSGYRLASRSRTSDLRVSFLFTDFAPVESDIGE
jgi:hypothetical protein